MRSIFFIAVLLAGAAAGANETPATDTPPNCAREEVLNHVVRQFRTYGPRSQRREYFGFIYRHKGEINSAVAEGSTCGDNHKCEVDTRSAGAGIPAGAKVLGEWHTHPHHQGSKVLSRDDVRGANHNRKIRCYTAYYSVPGGEFFAWNAASDSVPLAMRSRVRLGNYREPKAAARNILATVKDPDTADQ
jgi:hypothetical protein